MVDAVETRLERIRAKLARVRAHKPHTFGAGSHRYELAAPLTEAEVCALEATYRIELPADFRAFLRTAGASGAGPYYGLLPANRWGELQIGDDPRPDVAARPCPWRADLARDDETWDAVTEGLDEPFQGTIAIADQGCGNYVALVVTGEERGRVMYVALADPRVPFFPENRDFLDWYERWLDELLRGYKHTWFGMAMPGDEATLAAAAERRESGRRLDALNAMHQLPSLEVQTRAIVVACLADDDAVVRTAALQLIKAHKLVEMAEADVRRLLSDPDALVRRTALHVLVGNRVAWHDAARQALDDPHPENVALAADALLRADALREPEILALLRSPAPVVRKSGYWAARSTRSPAIFDQLMALSQTSDDEHALALQPLLAQLDGDALDPSRRRALLDRLLARIAAIDGPDVPSGEIHGLCSFVGEDARALATLLELARHPEPFARYTTAAVLGDLGSAEALPVLRALLDDTAVPRGTRATAPWSVGENARRAIAKIEGAIAKRS